MTGAATGAVAAGKSVGIIGANGQGKSALLKLVAGTLIPDEGWVRLVGGVARVARPEGGGTATGSRGGGNTARYRAEVGGHRRRGSGAMP